MPEPGAREARVARAVTAAATVFFALAAAWELFGPHLAGHYASSASMGIIADNMLMWRIGAPVWEYTAGPPSPAQYYCHHPWGIFWLTTALRAIFGRHDWVLRLAPVALSTLTPPLLHALGSALYRPAAGAAAAASFVVLPIALAFANFNALEVPVIAGSLAFLLGYARVLTKARRRDVATCVGGAVFAVACDWPGAVLVGCVLAFEFARSFALPARWFEPARLARVAGLARFDAPSSRLVRERRVAAWAWCTCATALVLVFHLAAFQRAGKLGDLLGSYGLRSAGADAPLAQVLASRRYWIELSFTPIAVALGKLGAGVVLARCVLARGELEFVPVAVLAMATVQYVVFRQGADVHVFWPHYFAAYFALAMAALVDAAARVAARLAAGGAEAREARAARVALAALAVSAVPLGLVLRDGLPALVYARETGGRFNEKGNFIWSDGDRTAALAWWAAEAAPEGRGVRGARAPLELHDSMHPTWAQVWALGGRVTPMVHGLPGSGARAGAPATAATTALDARFAADEVLAEVARTQRVRAVGPVWFATRGEPWAPIEGFALRESEPSLAARYFVNGTEPVRAVEPSLFATWEWRVHFGQATDDDARALALALALAARTPATLDEKRVAHNAAVARGDAAARDALAREVEAAFALPAGVPAGTRAGAAVVLGTRFVRGARDVLEVLLRADGPSPAGAELAISSWVTRPAALSLTMADPTERAVAPPPDIALRRHRAGFLYVLRAPIRKRPGVEVFELFTAPKRLRAARGLPVLELR